MRRTIGNREELLNTNDRVRELKESMGNDLMLDSLERSWSACAEQDWRYQLYERNDDGLNPLETLVHCARLGVYPKPEVLIAVSECFEHYFDRCGELPLEEAFFGRPRRGVGVYAKRRSSDAIYWDFESEVRWQGGYAEDENKPAPTATEVAKNHMAAILFRNGHSTKEMDLDTFLRNYRRWRAKSRPEGHL